MSINPRSLVPGERYIIVVKRYNLFTDTADDMRHTYVATFDKISGKISEFSNIIDITNKKKHETREKIEKKNFGLLNPDIFILDEEPVEEPDEELYVLKGGKTLRRKRSKKKSLRKKRKTLRKV
jgi:hypothetical protein